MVTVDVLDVNDNAPTFEQESYTAVIPENAPSGVNVVNITATDPDEGNGGIINYEIIDEGEASGKPHLVPFRRIETMFEIRIYKNSGGSIYSVLTLHCVKGVNFSLSLSFVFKF